MAPTRLLVRRTRRAYRARVLQYGTGTGGALGAVSGLASGPQN